MFRYSFQTPMPMYPSASQAKPHSGRTRPKSRIAVSMRCRKAVQTTSKTRMPYFCFDEIFADRVVD